MAIQEIDKCALKQLYICTPFVYLMFKHSIISTMLTTNLKKRMYVFALIASSIAIGSCGDDDDNEKKSKGPAIWNGPEITFTKDANADWTLPENQDKITEKLVVTRQNSGPIYNYQWWQDNFGEDATFDDISDDFWDTSDSEREFVRQGGMQGMRFALLEKPAEANDAWNAFANYGTLGDSTNFYSFHNIASIIYYLNSNMEFVSIKNDFYINVKDGDGQVDDESSTDMPRLVGHKLGVWSKEENIYFTLTITTWGTEGGAISYKRSTK
jgi:hypothetical protein